MRAVVLLLAAAAAACGIPDNSPVMRPGQDCMQCHGATAQSWSAAGTLFAAPDADTDAGVADARIYLQDSEGRSFTLTTNGAGNFYLAEQLKFPLRAQAEFNGQRMAMAQPIVTGSCNSCHTQPAQNGALGRLFVPAGGAPSH